MKNLRTRLMVAAAALVVAAGTASAQALRADIPFTFRAGGAILQPGTYDVTVNNNGGASVVTIRNSYSRETVFTLPVGRTDPETKWIAAGKPLLSFECGTSHCSLSRMWDGTREASYQFARPKLGQDEPSRMAVIVMRQAAD